MTIANISEIGCASHTPSSPIKRGKIKINGSNKINWRSKLKMIASLGFPIDWKKFDPIIDTDTKVNMNR